MESNNNLLSLRIFTADYYMHYPISGVDSTYSDYRGSAIKQVPIIRIFGTDAVGTKTCMHIHGVFPYLYIPYHEVDPNDTDRFTYQVASSLDKAINISLGQANSQSQHVYKVVLVKAIPFYGYHSAEHQFLKIYLYNPMFIKKSANLFQNGAILGKIHQPHESHVPYVLQFLIDYNLYGMSFLHVPSEVVRYRIGSKDINGIDSRQILNAKVERMSTSKIEIDIAASYILNRFQLNDETCKEHANPGIAFIWNDERMRRSKMEGKIPPAEVPVSQERVNIQPTKSDMFYREALINKLKNINQLNEESYIDQTIHTTDIKRTFNLKHLLSNSVYPAECSQFSGSIINASYIADHLTNEHILNSFNQNQTLQNHHDLNESVVNEELVLSLSQKQNPDDTLNPDEVALLEIMKQLDTSDDNVDDDSILAPLTQTETLEKKLSQNLNISTNNPSVITCGSITTYNNKNNQTNTDVKLQANYDYFLESDDELLNDFSLSLICEENGSTVAETNITKELFTMPQLDGGYDETPKKDSAKKSTNNYSPKPLLREKYAPLNITICKSPKRTHLYKIIEMIKDKAEISLNVISGNESKKPKLTSFTSSSSLIISTAPVIDLTCESDDDNECNKKDVIINNGVMELESVSTAEVINNRNNDQLHSYSALKSYKRKTRTEKKRDILKTIPEPEIEVQSNIVNIKETTNQLCANDSKENTTPIKINGNMCLSPTFTKILNSSPIVKLKKFKNVENECTTTKRYALRTRTKKCIQNLNEKLDDEKPIEKKVKKKPLTLEQSREWSKCEVARRYDTEKNFFPEPGPSNYNFYDYIDIPGYYHPLPKKDSEKTQNQADTPLNSVNEKNSPTSIEDECELNTRSFYDKSFAFDSPLSLSTQNYSPNLNIEGINDDPIIEKNFKISTPILNKLKRNFSRTTSPINKIYKLNDDIIIITPKFVPPTRKEILNTLKTYNIPDVVPPTPFFSNCDDVTTRKEIGNTILHIPGHSLNDCEEFRSSFLDNGLYNWRHNCFLTLTSTNGKTENIADNIGDLKQIREMLSTNKNVTIYPLKNPPTYSEVTEALLTNSGKINKNINSNNDEDSPIKIKKSKIQFILENAGDNDDCETAISLSPLTPDTRLNKTNKQIDEPTKSTENNNSPITSNNQITQSRQLNEQKHSNVKLMNPMNIVKTKHISKAKLSLNAKLNNLNKVNHENSMKCRRNNTNSPNLFSNSVIETQIEKNADEIICIDDDDDDEIPDANNICGTSNIHVKQILNTTNFSNVNLVKERLDRSSYVNNLNLDGRNYGSDHSFGITGASLENSYGFKMDLDNFQSAKANLEHNFLTIMSLEVHIQTRGNLKPDPVYDQISCIFYSIQNDVPENNELPSSITGVIIVDEEHKNNARIYQSCQNITDDTNIKYVSTEKELIFALLDVVQTWDPDILAGFEIEMASWGYVIQRGYAIEFNLPPLFSRVPSQKVNKFFEEEETDEHNEIHFEIKLCGRIILDVWRLLRSEIALTSYTYENVMYHILHRRYPLHSFKDLTGIWNKTLTRWIVLDYYIERTKGTLDLLSQLDLIGRTCELAKLFGIQFFEVLSRGSQFRVESMMLRIAKPKNIIPVSPSVQQRAHMRSPEYLPLILEPHSRFYADSMIVLDFQSLYPSMIIAYNYCFSTCLGRVEHLGQSEPFEFGASQLRVSLSLLKKLVDRDLITVSPCGAVFVKSHVREGVLPRMLREILDTRLMVKQSMKLHKNDKLLQRILHSRQLGLKLMANVTYGYTAANFSGRMPCVEVGDSVVSKGRETLERAIKLVEANKSWNCKVVYGDTDSLFVLIPGRSRTDAFKIGDEIAAAVTNDNPHPVKLKLEKIYQPSILQTKKRYVGYMYESLDQEKAIYEAKGIETVRRDGCPAVAKILEKSLKILFDTCDVSAVKKYVCRQFTKILSGRASIQDLVFAKEFRGINGYKPGACVPALELTKKWKIVDRRAEPRTGERVPYIVINGPPGVPLIRLVRSPYEFLENEGLKINALYYITKVIIPPLNRCFLLIGADVNQWFADLPRKYQSMPLISAGCNSSSTKYAKKSTISQYFATTTCAADCGEQTKMGICTNCLKNPNRSAIILSDKIAYLDRKYLLNLKICQSCCGRQFDTNCMSLDCPVLFVLNNWQREYKQLQYLKELLDVHFS